MAKLILKEFRCLDETNPEDDSDSPYFLVYVGNAGGNYSRVIKIRRESWDNAIGDNSFRQPEALVSDNVSVGGSLVLVALLEEDDGPDFAGSTLTKLRNRMKHWYDIQAGDFPPSSEVMLSVFKEALEDFKGNDDVMGVKELKITTNSGPLNLLNFTAHGGSYRVRFRMTP